MEERLYFTVPILYIFYYVILLWIHLKFSLIKSKLGEEDAVIPVPEIGRPTCHENQYFKYWLSPKLLPMLENPPIQPPEKKLWWIS